MIEQSTHHREQREILPNKKFQVTIIGAAASGKSTLLGSLQDKGYTVHSEPDNPVFGLFLENPKKFAFQNQLHKTAQLIELEILGAKADGLTDPHFRESGVLATEIYSRYLHDQGLMTDDQFRYLEWLYENHMSTFPKPDLVVYLYADDRIIKERAVKRDGTLAHDPRKLQPYWDKLLTELSERNIPVLRVNTGDHPVNKTLELALSEVFRLKEVNRGSTAGITFFGVPRTPVRNLVSQVA